ncbi:MAG TPA: Amuc_1100 family pilus-like protein [Chthoniobacter sp.]|jgi:hypothetical protein
MNWVKENKFLTGYIIVMVIGLGVLGFEVFSASGDYDDKQAAYDKQAAEYKRLRELHPFPSRQNLDEYEKQKGTAAAAITAFQVDLAKKEFPLTPLSPEKFQDDLKEAVTSVRKEADDAGFKLPDKFFLGFSKYETTPPTPEAAAPLGRELKAIKWIVDQFIAQLGAGSAITTLDRVDLPEEKPPAANSRGETGGRPGPGGRNGPRPPSAGGGGGNRAGGGARQEQLVHYYPFDITCICKQQKLQPLLNLISGPKTPQFYVIRQIQIRNQVDKGPARSTPAPDATQKSASAQFIVGEEALEAQLRIDVVDFVPPESSGVADQAAEKPAPPAK